VPARRDLGSIVGYATQAVTTQARKRTSNMRQFRVDAILWMSMNEHGYFFSIGEEFQVEGLRLMRGRVCGYTYE
jgi:hypothetical protein